MSLSDESKKFILVVEDDELYGNVYQKKLTNEGFDVTVVGNGAWVMPAIQQRKPNLIVLDLIMPVQNGYEILKELKAHPDYKNIKVIAVTNLGQEEDIEKAKKLGVDDYFVKTDLSIDQVVEKIKAII